MEKTERSSVDWKRFSEEDTERLENGKTYMVCSLFGRAAGELYFAKYRKEGAVIWLGLREDYPEEDEEMTARERLIRAIFGRRRSYTIPESGFYIETADYGVDEKTENGAFSGCEKQPVCVGNLRDPSDGAAVGAYWAEVPDGPEGVFCDLGNFDAPKGMKDKEKEMADPMEAEIAADPVMQGAFRAICGERTVNGGCFEYRIGPCVYSVYPVTVAKKIIDVWQFAARVSGIGEDEMREAAKRVWDTNTGAVHTMVGGFMERHGIKPEWRTLLLDCLLDLNGDAPGFCDWRDWRLKKGGVKALNVPGTLQEAYYRTMFPARLNRLVKLRALGAPDVILINELRMTVECEIAFLYTSDIVSVCIPDFADRYGVLPDGSEAKNRPRRNGNAEQEGDSEKCGAIDGTGDART